MTLFPYQEEGARWLAGRRRALLGDGMRVGKTRQAIVAADLVCARNVLVICPGIARENWGREFQDVSLFGRPIAVVLDSTDAIEPVGVTILSMDGSRNGDLHARVMAHRWDVMIVDEAHYLKEPTSQRTKQVVSARGFAANARHIWFLTGTPMLNHPAELWVMLRTIGAYTDDYRTFMDRFCEWFEGDYGPVVKKLKNVAELRALLAPHMLRRTYHEMFPDTPAPIWHDVELDVADAPVDYLTEYRQLEDHPRFGVRLKEWIRRVQAGEDLAITDVIPKSNFAEVRHATAWAKIKPVSKWLTRWLTENPTEKVVVFAHHGRMIELVQEDLRPFGAKTVYGGTKPPIRQSRIDAFNRNWKKRVLVVQDSIGRTAIDLTAASHLVFAELDPVPENNAQAAMRVQGPRQTKPVHIHVCRLAGTTDDAVTRMLMRKTQMAAELFT